VDDIQVAGPKPMNDDLLEKLSTKYDIKDLGETKYILGMEVERDPANKTILIHQNGFVQNLLRKSFQSDCKPVKTPQDLSVNLSSEMCPTNAEERQYMKNVPYREIVGALQYLATKTRPDIACAVGVVSRFQANPGPKHWKAVQRIVKYLQGTARWGILLGGDTIGELVGHSDADWGGDRDTRRSTTGYVFKLGNSTISWKSKLQQTVALSSVEAEYQALSAASQESVWLRYHLSALDLHSNDPTTIFEDNQGTIELVKSTKHHDRTKHIDIKHHYIRELVKSNQIEIKYKRTSDMTADILTKGLGEIKFTKFRKDLGMREAVLPGGYQ
jgi:hypothetical protein